MTYTLVAIFMATDATYVEREGLSLQACAGRAAMARMEYLRDGLDKLVGEVRWYCIPEHIEAGDAYGAKLDK